MSQLFPSCFFTRASPFLPSNSPTMPTASPISGSPCGQSLIPYNLVSSISRFSISIFTLFLFLILQISISNLVFHLKIFHLALILRLVFHLAPRFFTRIFTRNMKNSSRKPARSLDNPLVKVYNNSLPGRAYTGVTAQKFPIKFFSMGAWKNETPDGAMTWRAKDEP